MILLSTMRGRSQGRIRKNDTDILRRWIILEWNVSVQGKRKRCSRIERSTECKLTLACQSKLLKNVISKYLAWEHIHKLYLAGLEFRSIYRVASSRTHCYSILKTIFQFRIYKPVEYPHDKGVQRLNWSSVLEKDPAGLTGFWFSCRRGVKNVWFWSLVGFSSNLKLNDRWMLCFQIPPS